VEEIKANKFNDALAELKLLNREELKERYTARDIE
jgi:hypothetical protein